MAPPQSPCILRANLIKAKSSVPAVNCYLWGSFFFSKVVGYFQKHTDLGNRTQHTNEFTPLADFMQTTSKLNMRSGFSLPRTHGRGFCSLSLSFMQAFFHTIRHYRIECFSMEKLRFFFFFSDLKRFLTASGIQSDKWTCNCGRLLREDGLKWGIVGCN